MSQRPDETCSISRFSLITIEPSAIARALAAAVAVLVTLSVAGQLIKYVMGWHAYGLIPFFYVDEEQNLPAYFSGLLLLVAALLLGSITVLKKKDRAPYVASWAILCCGFVLMAFDELFSFHERLMTPMQRILGNDTPGIFTFAWVVPAIVLVLLLGVFFVKFLLHLSAKARFNFVLAAILYLGGAIGFELIEGAYAKLHGGQNLTFSMLTTVEESLEMIGVVVFIYGLLRYLADNYHEVRFRFGDGE